MIRLTTARKRGAVRSALPRTALEGPLLILSPHLDDAVLSCAALIERGRAAEILNIFDGEPEPPQVGAWDRRTGFEDSASSMAVRRAEDRAAFAGTPHNLIGLGLLDLQYVGVDRPSADRLRIESAISEWIETTEMGIIAAPAGAGRRRGRLRTRFEDRFGERGGTLQHPDHILVRDVALKVVAANPDVEMLLYEELPYLTGGPAEPELAALPGIPGRSCTEISVAVDRGSKARRIGVYQSQVAEMFIAGRRIDDPSALPENERYWHLSALPDLLRHGR